MDAHTPAEPQVKLPPGWMAAIGREFDKPYMKKLKEFLKQQKASGRTVYPKGADIFNALNTTAFEDVRVVILGQDPYHGPGQAHGLSFSVPKGVAIPPSLLNIYKEITRSCAIPMPKGGDLTGWARQGVLLLNATLTVEAAQAGSHQKQGWEEFTDAIVRALNDGRENIVFLLWGSYAQKKGAFIDRKKHLVLEAPHPSPLSAHRGFIGCGHFVSANEYLVSRGFSPVDWSKAG